MRFIIIFILFILNTNILFGEELLIYLKSAYKNNPVLNAERENYKAIQENINISEQHHVRCRRLPVPGKHAT